ncbi:MAG TPA: hypothetical protein VMM16_05985 [Verrucomicrobiae bacterium]|nr:hypothetical protein [Verrucomicrobiae bacterium]
MPQSIFIFDFGTNEEAAQHARHKVDAWRQGFRLGDKMTLKFERTAGDSEGGAKEREENKPAGKKASPRKEKKESQANSGNVRLLVRLHFSDHEKLTHQRWLDRLPAEEAFQSAKAEIVRTGDPEFPKAAERFESLD